MIKLFLVYRRMGDTCGNYDETLVEGLLASSEDAARAALPPRQLAFERFVLRELAVRAAQDLEEVLR